VTERSVSVLFCVELNNDHFNALSSVAGERGYVCLAMPVSTE
jgi:hypothetical protein